MFNKLLSICILLISLSLAQTTVKIQPQTVLQGDCFSIAVSTSAVCDQALVLFNNKTYPLYKISTNNYQVILGTPYETTAKQYPVIIRLFQQNQKVFARRELITVTPSAFETSTLIIKQTKQDEGATDFNILNTENLILGKAFKTQSDTRYWSTIFINPLKKPVAKLITSTYGKQRYYKTETGKLISTWAHRGIDYGIAKGTPAYAVNSGIITVSQPMQVHGETIVIDHGQGVSSIYNHLSTRLVKKGDYVTKGQKIALSGNTGLTTGPNLHYGLSVNNVRVNPQEWFTKGF